MYDPKTQPMSSLKQIIRYLKGIITHDFYLFLYPVDKLTTYIDIDWDDARTLEGPRHVIVFIPGTISFLVRKTATNLYFILLLKESIVVLLTLFLNLVGLKIYS